MKKTILKNNSKVFCVSIFTLIFFCAPVYAHYPWINITDYTPEAGSILEMTIGWGHTYPLAGFLKKDSVESLKIMGHGKTNPKLTFVSDLEIESEESISEPGAYIIAATRKAGFYTKTTQGGKRCSKKNLKNVISCSFSHMCMKAIVNVGEKTGNVDVNAGHPMEIIPLKNPIELRAGDYMPVQVLCNGKPFQGDIFATFAGFSTEKGAFAYACKTDKQGKGKIKILQPGVWMIKASHEEPYADKTECDMESFVATLTFEIR
jgi:uncharacterized GH25 family protein